MIYRACLIQTVLGISLYATWMHVLSFRASVFYLSLVLKLYTDADAIMSSLSYMYSCEPKSLIEFMARFILSILGIEH